MKLKDLLARCGYGTAADWADVEITDIVIDSRKVKPGALFVCIPGTKVDGHLYAGQAVASGAAALVVEHAEILLSQAKERGAVDLGVAAHPVACSRVQVSAAGIGPHVCGVVPILEEHGGRVPVFLLARQERAPLEDQGPLAGHRHPIRQRAPAGPRPDDDDLVSV